MSHQLRRPHLQVSVASDVGLEQIWSYHPFSYIRQLLLEEKEGLLGDIAFLQVRNVGCLRVAGLLRKGFFACVLTTI